MAKSHSTESSLPPIPPKHYFTIGEVSQLCDIKPHVLRYWEQEFLQLRQVKRRGNRRYYQPREVELIRHIRTLLYERGFTITGARHELMQRNSRSAPAGIEAQVLPVVTTKITELAVESINGNRSYQGAMCPEQFREELQQILLLLSR